MGSEEAIEERIDSAFTEVLLQPRNGTNYLGLFDAIMASEYYLQAQETRTMAVVPWGRHSTTDGKLGKTKRIEVVHFQGPFVTFHSCSINDSKRGKIYEFTKLLPGVLRVLSYDVDQETLYSSILAHSLVVGKRILSI